MTPQTIAKRRKLVNPNRNITRWFLGGIRGFDRSTKQRIILANVIFLVVPAIILVSYILDYDEYIKPIEELYFDQFTRLMFGIASIICYFLNRNGHFYFSRWFYILSWIAFWLVLDPVVQGTSSDYYFHFDLSIIGLSLVCQILFSVRKEPITFHILIAFTAVCILFQQRYLLHFDSNEEVIQVLLDNEYTYFTSIYYWAIFNLIIGYLIYVYEDSNTQLAENNERLDELTTNLEEAVLDRTEDLQTKKKELEEIAEKLRDSEQKYRTLFTSSFEGIARLEVEKGMKLSLPVDEQLGFLIDHLIVVDCNNQFAQMYSQHAASELIGKKLSDCVPDIEALKALLLEYLKSDYHIDGTTSKESILGKDRWFINHISSLFEKDELQWIWLNKLDVTEKAVQDKERKALLSDLEEYAFQTSHQLRGPLSRLLGLTELMIKGDAFSEEEVPEMLKHISATSKEIDAVIWMMNEVLSRSSYESKLTKKEKL